MKDCVFGCQTFRDEDSRCDGCKEVIVDSHHIVYVFRGRECLMVDPIPYSTLNEAKDHADWLRGEQGKTDTCFVFECNIDEQGDTFTVHAERYRATI